jgi:hypothetical protein
MKIRPIVAWYDFWVGFFWDRAKRRLYILPIPCIGIVIDFAESTQYMGTLYRIAWKMPSGRQGHGMPITGGKYCTPRDVAIAHVRDQLVKNPDFLHWIEMSSDGGRTWTSEEKAIPMRKD